MGAIEQVCATPNTYRSHDFRMVAKEDRSLPELWPASEGKPRRFRVQSRAYQCFRSRPSQCWCPFTDATGAQSGMLSHCIRGGVQPNG